MKENRFCEDTPVRLKQNQKHHNFINDLFPLFIVDKSELYRGKV